jgi:hypothetical protein
MKQGEHILKILSGNLSASDAIEQVASGLMSGEIPHSKGFRDEVEARKYARAVVSWYTRPEPLHLGSLRFLSR